MFLKFLLMAATAALVLGLGGCTQDGRCSAGEELSCTCSDGRAGVAICGADGSPGSCDCSATDGGLNDGGGEDVRAPFELPCPTDPEPGCWWDFTGEEGEMATGTCDLDGSPRGRGVCCSDFSC